ncbi:hypothetical protein RSAG8_11685, partial [Rhizoctonia solani AG-8 WAC10335]
MVTPDPYVVTRGSRSTGYKVVDRDGAASRFGFIKCLTVAKLSSSLAIRIALRDFWASDLCSI